VKNQFFTELPEDVGDNIRHYCTFHVRSGEMLSCISVIIHVTERVEVNLSICPNWEIQFFVEKLFG
jgi:hypothetical protein